jgi:glutamine synthetase
VDAIPAYVSESSVEMFEKLGVMTRRELEARKEIKLEEYAGLINIEARTMIDMASKLYIPAVISYVDRVASSMSKVKSACAVADVSAQEAILLKASSLLAQTQKALDTLKAVTEKADSAASFHDTVLPAMDALRAPIDELETIVDRDYWPVPTYGELMFEV